MGEQIDKTRQNKIKVYGLCVENTQWDGTEIYRAIMRYDPAICN